MNYDVDYFIRKFSAIPEEKWCVGFFKSYGKSCANGHCGVTDSISINEESIALAEILSPLKQWYWPSFCSDPIYEVTVNINDGFANAYKQPTPKQRILAALYDIKAMQEKKDIDTGGKVKTVYVAVPATISEQAKELVLS